MCSASRIAASDQGSGAMSRVIFLIRPLGESPSSRQATSGSGPMRLGGGVRMLTTRLRSCHADHVSTAHALPKNISSFLFGTSGSNLWRLRDRESARSRGREDFCSVSRFGGPAATSDRQGTCATARLTAGGLRRTSRGANERPGQRGRRSETG